MSVNERLRNQILDELRSKPNKTKRFNDDDFEKNPDLLGTLEAMEHDRKISIVRSTRNAKKRPILITLR